MNDETTGTAPTPEPEVPNTEPPLQPQSMPSAADLDAVQAEQEVTEATAAVDAQEEDPNALYQCMHCNTWQRGLGVCTTCGAQLSTQVRA